VSVACFSGRGLCDGLITRPEESYRLWCVLMCDLETSRMRRLKLVKSCKCRIEEEEEEELCEPPAILFENSKFSSDFVYVLYDIIKTGLFP
jgi:hypothetical protein